MSRTAELVASGHWSIGKDGHPENPKANPKCKPCNGHGVVEDSEASWFCSVLIDCACTKLPKPTRARCGYAKRYKATRAPTCGCQACADKWVAKVNAGGDKR